MGGGCTLLLPLEIGLKEPGNPWFTKVILRGYKVGFASKKLGLSIKLGNELQIFIKKSEIMLFQKTAITLSEVFIFQILSNIQYYYFQ